ncbi:MAG: excinuclease ABC subunit UvrA [Candidatus Omnitrophota bacterium]|nr:excinuclease ABC subunit UvrA [Candidatus Omnitrophota bacterium]
MQNDFIVIRKARVHNLKGISLALPRNKLVVFTGLSGSGKSSLAFDTIYAEGQRRYVESLSSYARQFLERLDKPDVEYIEGLSPAIAIEQKTAGANPRSTVGTQTEINDYLRLLFARIGIPHCYKCGKVIQRQTSGEIVSQIIGLAQGTNIEILAPLIKGRKGEYRDILNLIQKEGFVRARIDGKVYELDKRIKLDKYKVHNIEAVVDRVRVDKVNKKRITDSVETALKAGKGTIIVHQSYPYGHRPVTSHQSKKIDGKTGGQGDRQTDLVFSELYACAECGINLSEIEPRVFSFNSPYGACPSCNGLGTKMEFDIDLIIPDKNKSIISGALEPWRKGGRGYLIYYRMLLRELAGRLNFSLDTPFNKLGKRIQTAILYGTDELIWNKPFEGILPHLERLFNHTDSDYLKEQISKFMSILPCPDCGGSRLKKESLAVKIREKSIYDIALMPLKAARDFFSTLRLLSGEEAVAGDILKEINARLNFCINVGLDYLTLERRSSTLSGGESQRIRLATQVGSGLTGVIYVLDEPSIGLHQKDNQRLLATLKSLRDLGNTLIVVEHDEATIRESDYVVDLGPAAGRFGGEVMFAGEVNGLLKDSRSLTAKYLRKELSVYLPKERRSIKDKKYLELFGCKQHNLKNINVRIPLGVFTCISGVSGSGKSTLIDEILFKALAREIYKSKVKPGKFEKIKGAEYIDKVIEIDQSPIGRTPRSNPATYTGVFSFIRGLFSQLPEAKLRGYKPGRFSFNVKGGRCEACSGDGIKKIEMHFLPDVYVVCEVCEGRRFTEQTQAVMYKGKSISDVLEMPVDEAYALFENIPAIKHILGTLIDVGLGYIQLGQSATTLSGGEAQRMKLASELSKRSTGNTFYILDEPTTGLHFADVDKLLKVLGRLVERENSVVVVEHNLDVLKSADYIIDLGPQGGDKGGEVVACGSPEEVARNKNSYTGQFLREVLMTNAKIQNQK